MSQEIGLDHSKLLKELLVWLEGNRPVCFVDGFSGVGKTYVGDLLIDASGWDVVKIEVPPLRTTFESELIGSLMTKLMDSYPNRANAIDPTKPLATILLKLLQDRVLLIFDDFQQAFIRDSSKYNTKIDDTLKRLATTPRLQGRLLLLSNWLVERETRWSDPFVIHTLSGLNTEEAQQLLEDHLKQIRKEAAVPLERRREVVKWLGNNPRAIGLLAAGLRHNPLDNLIQLNPNLGAIKDPKLSAKLLLQLEEEILDRIIIYLPETTVSFLRQLSVHRKSFETKAMLSIVADPQIVEAHRDELIDHFLLEYRPQKRRQDQFKLNPVAREVVFQRLQEGDPSAFRQAHSNAADYYMRHFTGKQIIGGKFLQEYFVEAYYHLIQANRTADLAQITNRFSHHLGQTYHATSPIPKPAELNEVIAVLQALPDDSRTSSLDYYLARLFKARGQAGDLEHALTYARHAADPHASVANWVLYVQLEQQINGLAQAIQVAQEGINYISPDKNLASLYIKCGELLAQAQRLDEAIELLQQGLERIPDNPHLYIKCGELLAQAGRLTEAITLLQEGVKSIPDDPHPYIKCGELLAQAGRLTEAIELLQQGIQDIPSDKNLSLLYVKCGKLLAQDQQPDAAIALLREGTNRVPMNTLFSLYQCGGKVFANANRIGEAIDFLKEGMTHIPISQTNQHRVVENAIFLCAASKNKAELTTLMQGDGANLLNAQSLALAQVVVAQIEYNWQKAAEIATAASKSFPNDISLLAQAAFSWLCVGNISAAQQALKNFSNQLQMRPGNPTTWLKGWIELKSQTLEQAAKTLSAYLGHSQSPQDLSDASFLELWDQPVGLETDTYLSFYFPTLPSRLTGLDEPITRLPFEAPVLPALLAKQAARQPVLSKAPRPGGPSSEKHRKNNMEKWQNLFPVIQKVSLGLAAALAVIGGGITLPQLLNQDESNPDPAESVEPDSSASAPATDLVSIDINVYEETEGTAAPLEGVLITLHRKGSPVEKRTNSSGYVQVQIPPVDKWRLPSVEMAVNLNGRP
jgi:tetratricopeptide (TPR) repeat protein